MPSNIMPGTVLATDPGGGNAAFAAITSLCSAAGGLSLSQITAITGLEASTVQNWVKRGWVSRPVGKKYAPRQISRILLINLLRDALPLESIARLMSGVNGEVEDVSDDIIDEGELYDRLCALLEELDDRPYTDGEIRAAIKRQLADYRGPLPDSRARLSGALEIMVLAVQASRLKRLAERRLEEWL
ncbi:MAG: DUF1836 domain-containing protein [Acutalibacteraceae bacterium]|jgi:DNA-binding transcriptional MerR regulator